MLMTIDPNAELGPTGMFIGAGVFALIACGTFISGVHPQWRTTAKWKGSIARSPVGSAMFAIGMLIMGAGLIARGVLNQHGPFTGVPLWLFAGGAAVGLSGPVFDWIQSVRTH